METKKCNKCNQEKDISEFEYRTDTHKYRNTCKECRKNYLHNWHKNNLEHVKKYLKNNKEHITERNKHYYEEHKEHLRQYSKTFRNDNKDYYKNYMKEYRQEHKEDISNYNKKWLEDNKEHRRTYKRKYNKDNKEFVNSYRRLYEKKRLETNTLYKLKQQLRHLIGRSFERRGYKKNSRTEKIIGCDYESFIKYLLETYKNNYGVEYDNKEKVHIDHIIPLSKAKTEEDIIKLCHYTNLQLLKAKDNIDKSDNEFWKLNKNISKSGRKI